MRSILGPLVLTCSILVIFARTTRFGPVCFVTCQDSAGQHCAPSYAGHCLVSFAKSTQTVKKRCASDLGNFSCYVSKINFSAELQKRCPSRTKNQHAKIHESVPRRHRVSGAEVSHNRKTCFKTLTVTSTICLPQEPVNILVDWESPPSFAPCGGAWWVGISLPPSPCGVGSGGVHSVLGSLGRVESVVLPEWGLLVVVKLLECAKPYSVGEDFVLRLWDVCAGVSADLGDSC